MDDFRKIREAKLTDLEYETQYFGCSSEAITEMTSVVVREKVEANLTNLISTMYKYEKDKNKYDKLQDIKVSLYNMYQNALESNIREYKKSVKELFTIPSAILLPEDQDQLKQYSEADVERIDKKINSLNRRIEKVMYIEATLKRSSQQIEEFVNDVENVTKQMKMPVN